MTGNQKFHFGARVIGNGVTFSLWAPTQRKVELLIDGSRIQLSDQGEGWREQFVDNIKPGTFYHYVIDGTTCPDPASRYQPEGVFGPSQVVDETSFRWTDKDWVGRPWSEAVIWEAHVGTATGEGTYRALIDRLPHLQETGVTAIELMPLAESPGTRNWGYDGVLPYAPKAQYGSPDELKALVDAAHQAGIMVLLDVVYNHFGPSGNFLHLYAERFFTQRHHTPWGAGINFDGQGNAFVRAFFIKNALYWLQQFHMDGLRFDAAHAMLDDSPRHFLQELAQDIREHLIDRQVHLILENEHNDSSWLERDAEARPKQFTAQWNDDFHHCWHVLVTGEDEGYYSHFSGDTRHKLVRSLCEGFVFQGEVAYADGRTRGKPSGHLPPAAFVAFLQNHDQVGNRALGERLDALGDARKIELARTVLLLCPQVPMLFMGEEWGSRTPFCFFVDFSQDEALSRAVREGRQREFSAFKAFAEGVSTQSIPDPTDVRTFELSKLAWSDLARPEHARILARTTRLLDLRRQHVDPLIASTWMGAAVSEGDLVDIEWRFSAGVLRLRLNVSDVPKVAVLSSSESVIEACCGAEIRQEIIHLPSWSCVFSSEAA